MDVKIDFLHRDLGETIYMEQPGGFVEDKAKVCLLKKYLYELKQIPHKWYSRFEEFILKHDFVRSDFDNHVNILKRNGKVILFLFLYVDDIWMEDFSNLEINKLKDKFNGKLEMKIVEAKRIVGTDIM